VENPNFLLFFISPLLFVVFVFDFLFAKRTFIEKKSCSIFRFYVLSLRH